MGVVLVAYYFLNCENYKVKLCLSFVVYIVDMDREKNMEISNSVILAANIVHLVRETCNSSNHQRLSNYREDAILSTLKFLFLFGGLVVRRLQVQGVHLKEKLELKKQPQRNHK